jgi:hypoxanthine phosphoribosyltransferase
MATDLCNQLLPFKNKFEWIVGVERGGLPLSNWLSYVMGKPHTSVQISLYGDGDKIKINSPYVWLGLHHETYLKHPFLLVDDIVDSGKTLALFRDLTFLHKPKFMVATLHWCPENNPNHKPDFYIETKKKEDWIVYPWSSPTEGESYSQ